MIISPSANAAAPPPQPDAAQIEAALRKLGVIGSVLYVAAHPDDENTNLIAYLANHKRLRTGYLSITRGDGGQNLIGAEQGTELGVIRTQELLAARRVDGGEQWFTRARDFGYSKTPEETLRIWGRDAVLADVVLVIRRFRPDVIITRFSPEPSDTHGHHTASAMLARDAFRAAADPKFLPEQLALGITPWQARRLLWNRSTFNLKPGEDLSSFHKLDVSVYSPLLGASTGELAAESRSMHKSQGFGVAPTRGPILEYFKVLDEVGDAKAAAALKDIFEGIDFTWSRFPGGKPLGALVERAVRQLTPTAPHEVLPLLLDYDAALDKMPDVAWREQKRREVHRLMTATVGLFADATAADFRVAPGAELESTAVALNRSPAPLVLKELRWPDGTVTAVGKTVTPAAAFEAKRKLTVPAALPATTPYWLVAAPEPGLFRVADPRLIGLPEPPPPLGVDFVFEVGAPPRRRPVVVNRPITFKWTDPVAGERYRPLEVIPAVTVRPQSAVLLFPNGKAQALRVRLAAGAPAQSGTVRLGLPPGWSAQPAQAPFSLRAKGDTTEVAFTIKLAAVAAIPPQPIVSGTLRVVAEVGGQKHARGAVQIEHAHIPIQTLLVDAQVRLVPLALETTGTRLGYIPGPGDEVPASLARVGYDVTLLSDETLAGGPSALTRFDAVVVGVRAYNTNERLRAAHATLMTYVEAGGTLVVQYNTNNRLSPLAGLIGPWPFDIGRDRITNETAPVTFTAPTHPAVTSPNKLGPADFTGWVQERGLYFASTWDPRYQTPLSMADPGEKALAGGVLWGRSGKGTFVYTGLAFFRQLPAGVPGAFRLFANLLAGGKSAGGR